MKSFVTRVLLLAIIFVAFASACDSDYAIWIPRDPDAEALYRFEKGDRIGYIDRSGKVAIPPTIKWLGGNYGGEFHCPVLETTSIGRGPYVDSTGVPAITTKLDKGWDFSEGLAGARKVGDGPFGYIDTSGVFVIPPRFKSDMDNGVSDFSDGLAAVQVDGRYGYIDHSGNFVIPPRLPEGSSFHDGYARVVVEGPCAYLTEERPCPGFHTPGVKYSERNAREDLPLCKFTFIDKSGRVLSDKRYDYALDFSEGLAPVEMNHRWGYIDNTGEIVIEPRFESAEPFSGDVGLVKENGLFGFIDKRGFYVVAPKFRWAESFADDLAVVRTANDGQVWYIAREGKQAFPRKFAEGSSFFKGLAHVKLLPRSKKDEVERFEYIDTEGNTVFAYTP